MLGIIVGLAAIQSLVRGIRSGRRVLMWVTVIGFVAVSQLA